MLSIGQKTRHESGNNNIGEHPLQGGRRVLPRLLRRPVRSVRRLFSGDICVSRRGWMAVGLIVILGVCAITLADSRQGEIILADISAKAGFAIKGVRIDGANQISKSRIIEQLDFGYSKSLVTFDVHKARLALRQLPWVSDAVISKSFPDFLDIRIVESKPFAIWQHGMELALIERNGKTIADFKGDRPHLPLLVGTGANLKGAEIYAQVQRSKSLAGKVRAYIRVADRRWDLELDNGIRIRLPDNNPSAALARIDNVENSKQLLARDLDIIDLRLENQLVVRLRKKAIQQNGLDQKQIIDTKTIGKPSREKKT